MQEQDFSSRTAFPGTRGNPFDVILHRLEEIQSIPAPLFSLLLFALASLPAWGNWLYAFALWAFFLTDWLLLALLPRLQRSFGPARPPTLILSLLRSLFALLPVPLSLTLQVIGTLIVIYAFWIEPFRLQVTHQVLSTPKFTASRPLRLLHLGDLHIERLTPRETRLNALIDSLKPDIILFSGDILNLSYLNDPTAWQAARQLIGHWQAPLGVFFVSGSPAVDLPEILPDLLKDLPLTWLQDSKTAVKYAEDVFEVIGISCSHRPHQDAPRLAALINEPSNHLRILLYHSPDLAPAASRLGVDLQLSGHTHGGQVRLPFLGAVFTGSLYGKAFEAGRYRLNKMVLYITRGLGLEGAAAPRLRFLCPPEIILWEIKGENRD